MNLHVNFGRKKRKTLEDDYLGLNNNKDLKQYNVLYETDTILNDDR